MFKGYSTLWQILSLNNAGFVTLFITKSPKNNTSTNVKINKMKTSKESDKREISLFHFSPWLNVNRKK